MPLPVFFYGAHTRAIDQSILRARPRYAIINTQHGLWGQIPGSNVIQDVSAYKEAGIKVICYLTSGYESQGSGGKIDPRWYTLETNLKLIRELAEIEKIDGVFIDECSAFPSKSSRDYLRALTDLAKSYDLVTWGNVGQADFDSWFFSKGGFDLMHSNENWHGQDLSPVQRDWGHRMSVTGFDPGYTAQHACNLTTDAWEKGLAYCYICGTGYDSLPSWFEAYVGSLRNYLAHARGARKA